MRRRQLQLLEGGCAGGRFLWGTKGTAMSSLGFGSSTICNPFARHSPTRGSPRAPTAFIFHRSRSTFLPSLHLRSSKNSSTLLLRIGAAATFSASSFLLVSSFVHASSSTSASSPFAAVFAQEQQRQVAAKAEQEQEQEQQPVDPLQEDTRMSVYEWIKTVLGGLFLVPLRLSIIVPSCLATYVLVKMGLVALNALEKVSAGRFNRERWRQLLFALPLRCMLRGMLFVTGFYWLEVKGRPADLSEVSILVCNHTSQLDPILLLAATGQVPSMVSKASIQRLPCVGEVASALDCVFVERMDSKSRVAALDAIKERAKRKHGPQLLIFPEGTITNGKALLSFRAGAVRPTNTHNKQRLIEHKQPSSHQECRFNLYASAILTSTSTQRSWGTPSPRISLSSSASFVSCGAEPR
ncbi:Lysophosphatidylcholine acyltransferase 2 [Balamuthia mandrillaris]